MVHMKVKSDVPYPPLPFPLITKYIRQFMIPHSWLPNRIIIYSNWRTKISIFTNKLEQFLGINDDLYEYDVLTLDAVMKKEENT